MAELAEKDKSSKKTVDYISNTNHEDRCKKCRHFISESETEYGFCESVRGLISPNGWCQRWQATSGKS